MPSDEEFVAAELIEVIEVGNTLGEGLLWRESDSSLWWTDIVEKRLYCLDWETREQRIFELPERLGSFGFVQGGDDVLFAAFESGFAYYYPASGELVWLDRFLHDKPGLRLNDGRTAPDGSFFCGSMVEDTMAAGGHEKGELYRFSPDGKRSVIRGDIQISNGISWSPDGTRIYFSDSPKRLVASAPFDPVTGEVGTFESFGSLTPHGAYPDGAIVDADGRYWSARWSGGHVACHAPDGRLIMTLAVPAPQPTICTFGGESLDLLFVASAREGMGDDMLRVWPQSGNIFVYKSSVKGRIADRVRHTL